MIEAVTYGMIPSAKTEKRESAPPENSTRRRNSGTRQAFASQENTRYSSAASASVGASGSTSLGFALRAPFLRESAGSRSAVALPPAALIFSRALAEKA